MGASDRYFRCVDPYTEESWGRFPEAGAAEVEKAVLAARRAFDSGVWPGTPPAKRAALLRRLGVLVEERLEDLAARQIHENGKLAAEVRATTALLASACDYFAGLAENLSGVGIPLSQPNLTAFTVREPIGVIAAIAPWNNPLLLLAWKLLPALAAGNTVVAKPSEVTPASTLLLAELITKAGFPDGVVNVVTGAAATGDLLMRHQGVDMIAFTGSTAVGTIAARAAAERQARLLLELGGKSPNIVFADADLDNAVNGIMAGIFAASGQSCMAGSRVLLEKKIYGAVAARLSATGPRLRAGDPLDESTQLGPVASRAQLEKVLGYFDVAKQEGLEVLCGGQRMPRQGFFVEPTVYGNVGNDSRIAREEIFGPVIALIPFEGEEQAVAIANDTRFGLAAGVWTKDVTRAHRMASRIRAGTVWINNYRVVSYSVPFGGFRQSGIGRELGPEALHAFTEVKSIWVDTGNEIRFPAG